MKDPAFLFYTNDFISGTQFLSDEQTGKYIRLLCAQHQHGHLREKDMLKICISHDQDILDKFVKDDEGLFYNERLEIEINRRKSYSESRSNNRKKVKKTEIINEDINNISNSYLKDMEDETINRDINENKDIGGTGEKGKFKIPTQEEINTYCLERKNSVDPVKFFNFYESKGWMIGKNKMKNWKACVHIWEKSSEQNKTPAEKSVFNAGTNKDYKTTDWDKV